MTFLAFQTNADSITALWATILKLDEEFDARGRRQGEEEEESRENGDGGEDEFEDYRYSEGDQPTKAKALREVLLKVRLRVASSIVLCVCE